MIDIVAILFSPNVTPSGLAVSGTTSIKVNEESFGSYIMSSVMFTLNTVSCPKEELNKTFDEGRSKSAAVYKDFKLVLIQWLYLHTCGRY